MKCNYRRTRVLSLACIFNALTILFLTHLVGFHIYLQREELTTFDYLMGQVGKRGKKSKLFKKVNKEDEESLSKVNENAPSSKESCEGLTSNKKDDEIKVDGPVVSQEAEHT